ncbi:MAG: hypothetical protein L0287_10050 [Anaerolineae bacterium]|nr:hypothetical protein [Anaerolineae bacterium]
MDEKYKALGVQHHETDNKVEPQENHSLRATIVVVCIFIACFVASLMAIRVLRP